MSAAGSPTRFGSFVAYGERERLLAALAELVSARGYDEVSAADITEHAGVDQSAFARHFADKQECFLAAFDAASAQAFSAAADAYMRTGGGFGEGARAALGALLRYVAGTPAFAHLCCVAILDAGPEALAHRDETLRLFMEFLEPGYAHASASAKPPRLVSLTIPGGVFELFRLHVMSGRLHELPDALPAVTEYVLAPFLGLSEARRLAALPGSGDRSGNGSATTM